MSSGLVILLYCIDVSLKLLNKLNFYAMLK